MPVLRCCVSISAMAQSQVNEELISEVEGEVKHVARKRTLRAIIVTRGGPMQLAPLAKLIAELRGCPVAQAARRIENAGGIILRDATGDEEAAIARELHRQDVPFISVPAKELLELAGVSALEAADVKAGGLHLRCRDGSSVELKWKGILSVTCVRLEAPGEGAVAPARLILTLFTRKPFECYQLSQNIPAGPPAASRAPHEAVVRFRRAGKAIYEKFTRSAQNKGMRILANRGLRGKWKGLSFEKSEQVQGYNYWLALLRKYQAKARGAKGPKLSIPSLCRIEFEREVTPPGSPAESGSPARRLQRRRVIFSRSDWMPYATRYAEIQSLWLKAATLIAAICLAIFIALELFG